MSQKRALALEIQLVHQIVSPHERLGFGDETRYCYCLFSGGWEMVLLDSLSMDMSGVTDLPQSSDREWGIFVPTAPSTNLISMPVYILHHGNSLGCSYGDDCLLIDCILQLGQLGICM